MRSVPQLLHSDLATGLTLLIAIISALAAWLALALVPGERPMRAVYLLTGLMLAIAAASTWGMVRMSSYLMWAAVPAGATLAARLAQRFSRTTPAPRVRLFLFGLILAPSLPAAFAVAAMRLYPAPPASKPVIVTTADDGCFRPEAYRELAALSPGVTVAEPDLGAFVLVYTRSGVVAASYHRADKGIIAAHAILAATPDRARALARAAGATYVLTCPAHGGRGYKTFGAPRPTRVKTDQSRVSPPPLRRGGDESASMRADMSLGAILDAGRTPGWLTRLSPASSAIQIFRVASGDGSQLRSTIRTSLSPDSAKNEAPRRLVDTPALKGPKSVAGTPVQSTSSAT
jgi:hypothetical protein